MKRGEFFTKAFTLAIGKTLETLSDNKVVATLEEMAEEPKTRERPPGANPNDQKFQELCSGCDACMIACPVSVVMIEDMDKRFPLIYPEEAPCIHCEDYPCIKACPTGALHPDFLEKN